MPKTKISEWSSTPANNTDIDSINIAEGCAPSGINDAIRELMSQVKDLYAGTSGDIIAVAAGGTGVSTSTGSGNNVLSTSPTLVTPALGTPSALVGTNITGTAAGLTAGNVTTNANLTGAITSVGNTTSLGSFTSAQLATALTDETGSGANVFATSPTLVTPILGTPTSVTLTNATGLPISTGVSGLGTGIATALAVNTGSAGAPVLFNGALGTPSSGTVTNLTGTASININGTVGATTASTGAFTTLSATGALTVNGLASMITCATAGSGAHLLFRRSELIGVGGEGVGLDALNAAETATVVFAIRGSSIKLLADTSVLGTLSASTSIGVGNATPSSSGAGITFPATQSASTDANTLDDYEEGTWTPTQGGGLTVVGTFSSSGRYEKIGRQVRITAVVSGTTSVAVNPNGEIMAGVPFSAGSAIPYQSGALVNASFTLTGVCSAYNTSVYSSTTSGATANLNITITYNV